MDIDILLFLQTIREQLPGFVSFLFNWISHASIIAAVLCIFIYLCINKEKGQFILKVVILSNVIMQTLKNIFCINRPWVRDHRVTPYSGALGKATGYSFPSGHTTLGCASYGSMIDQFREKKWMKWVCIPLIILIGFSRNFLGVHTPQDVLVGLCIGALSIIIVKIFTEKSKLTTLQKDVLMIIGLIGLSIFTVCKSYPVVQVDGEIVVDTILMQKDALQSYGIAIGFILGNAFDRKFVQFTTDGLSTKQRIVRFAISLIGAGLVYAITHFVFKTILPIQVYAFTQGIFFAFCCLGIIPLLFKKIEKSKS